MMDPIGAPSYSTPTYSMPHSRPSTLSINPFPAHNQLLSRSPHFFPPVPVTNTTTYTTAPLNLSRTPTTPKALTPNSANTFMQSILHSLGEDPEDEYVAVNHHHAGTFVPPLPSHVNWQRNQSSESLYAKHKLPPIPEEGKLGFRKVSPNPSLISNQDSNDSSKVKANETQSRSRKVSEDDDERRRIRREKNKEAAARCRKRRLDRTNQLLEETEGLEMVKRKLQKQISDFNRQRTELEALLQQHSCAMKSFPYQNGPLLRRFV